VPSIYVLVARTHRTHAVEEAELERKSEMQPAHA